MGSSDVQSVVAIFLAKDARVRWWASVLWVRSVVQLGPGVQARRLGPLGGYGTDLLYPS